MTIELVWSAHSAIASTCMLDFPQFDSLYIAYEYVNVYNILYMLL